MVEGRLVALEQCVAECQRAARRARTLAGIAIATSLAIVLLGQTEPARTPDVIKAKEISVVGDDGRILASLIGRDGAGAVALYSKSGVAVAGLYATGSGGRLALCNESLKEEVVLYANAEFGELWVNNKDSVPLARVGGFDGRGLLTLNNPVDGSLTVQAGGTDKGSGYVTVYDGRDKPLIHISGTEKGEPRIGAFRSGALKKTWP